MILFIQFFNVSEGSNQIAENQEEMVKLRDQLVNTFREQMDIR